MQLLTSIKAKLVRKTIPTESVAGEIRPQNEDIKETANESIVKQALGKLVSETDKNKEK